MKKKILKKLKDILNIYHYFGIKFASLEFCINIIFSKIPYLKRKIIIVRNKAVKNELYAKYRYVIERYKVVQDNCEKIERESKIFIFWWQGFDNCPEIVNTCISSIKRNSINKEVIMISRENYKNYIDVPSYIMCKVEKGIIPLAHFSDLLRVMLLEKYGGIWFDATIYLSKSVDDEIYNYGFYSIKHGLYSDFHICKGLWTTSVLMSSRNNPMMSYIKDFLLEYWKKENYVITYLFLDCVISLGYDYIEYIKKYIDSVPKNNEDIFKIENNFSNYYNKNIFDMERSKTYIYKTNYKRKLLKEKKGQLTFYGQLLLRSNKI